MSDDLSHLCSHCSKKDHHNKNVLAAILECTFKIIFSPHKITLTIVAAYNHTLNIILSPFLVRFSDFGIFSRDHS